MKIRGGRGIGGSIDAVAKTVLTERSREIEGILVSAQKRCRNCLRLRRLGSECGVRPGSDPAPRLSRGSVRRRRLRRLALDVVEVQYRVEQHVELAEVLPPVARIPGEQDHPPLS